MGNTEVGGEVDRPEKEPPHRANLADWDTGPTRFAQRFNQDTCDVLHLGWKNSTQQYRLGSDWMKCISAVKAGSVPWQQ